MLLVNSRLLLIYGLIALVALVCWPSSVALGRLWMDYDNLAYTHGPLVALVSLWLIFRARQELADEPARPYWPAIVGLCVTSLAWFVFFRAHIMGLHLALLPVLAGMAI